MGDAPSRPPAAPGAPQPGAAAARLFAEEVPRNLTAEQARLKREIYEKMNPRRRKFVDRLGYDLWDPFQAPKDPLDIRTERSQRTAQDLLDEFSRAHGAASRDRAYRAGAVECAIGVINKDEKFQGIFDFCLWYHDLLKKEGHLP
ncbi:MAG: hypothetical protein HDR50_01835 [Desulfovibrio sp.]|uniref:hypothetical protein n=1 Tax=Desulfovibrio sp. TaxID=885 RepID=UPI001A70587E|nr:hypothetical protein [Desulfovibrio sp.]MBD5416426.1 hypothetical protein [Desulfovibrio sp.]